MENLSSLNRFRMDDRALKRYGKLLVGGFLFARLAALLAMPLEGLRGYGDFIHFFNLASLPGWPFFAYWVEFPPIFPFLLEILYRLAGGQQHVFDYLLFFVLTLADAGSLYLFTQLASRIYSPQMVWVRVGAYLIALLGLAYAWWYFDSLAVFFTLLGLTLLLDGKQAGAGLTFGAGILTKLFPGLGLVALWRRVTRKQAIMVCVAALLPVVLIWGVLWVLSPSYTAASLGAQGSKGSWETVWALLDGNYRTGNFGALIERMDAASALRPVGNPAVISPWITLIVFGLGGLWALLRTNPQDERQSLALVGFAWSLFLLWSPGWSVQWVLYLLPLILLVLAERQALLFAVMLVLVNLLEWPVLLSRGMFEALPLTVGLRTLLLVLLALVFYREARAKMV